MDFITINFVYLLQQILGCCIICAVMQEYASTVKSADVALQLETHLSAKKQFEVGLVYLVRNINVSFPKYLLYKVFPISR